MVHKAPARTGAPNHSALRRPMNVKFTTHALHTLDVRGIKMTEVRRALEDDPILQVSTDQKTGNTVYTTSHFKVVARENNNDLLVVTVMNADELNK
jgi:hypothetical protein